MLQDRTVVIGKQKPVVSQAHSQTDDIDKMVLQTQSMIAEIDKVKSLFQGKTIPEPLSTEIKQAETAVEQNFKKLVHLKVPYFKLVSQFGSDLMRYKILNAEEQIQKKSDNELGESIKVVDPKTYEEQLLQHEFNKKYKNKVTKELLEEILRKIEPRRQEAQQPSRIRESQIIQGLLQQRLSQQDSSRRQEPQIQSQETQLAQDDITLGRSKSQKRTREEYKALPTSQPQFSKQKKEVEESKKKQPKRGKGKKSQEEEKEQISISNVKQQKEEKEQISATNVKQQEEEKEQISTTNVKEQEESVQSMLINFDLDKNYTDQQLKQLFEYALLTIRKPEEFTQPQVEKALKLIIYIQYEDLQDLGIQEDDVTLMAGRLKKEKVFQPQKIIQFIKDYMSTKNKN